MVNLDILNLSWNQLTSLRDELTVLRKHCPALSSLDIRSNPWIKVSERHFLYLFFMYLIYLKADNMYLRVIGRLRSLSLLNNIKVSENDAASALQLVSGSRISQVSKLFVVVQYLYAEGSGYALEFLRLN